MWLTVMAVGAFFLSAAAEPDEKAQQRERQVQFKKVTEHIFGDLSISAVADKPGIDLVTEPPPMKFNPLIRLRADFDDELRGSIDEVK